MLKNVWWKPTVNQFQAKPMSKTRFIINTTNREMPQDVLNNKCIWSIISFSVPTLTHNITLSPLQQNIDLQQNTDSHLNQVTTVIDVKNQQQTSVFGRPWRVTVWPLFDLYLTLTTSLSALTDLDVTFSCHIFLSISNLSVSIFFLILSKKSQNVVLQQVQRSAVAQWPHTGSCRHQHQAPHPWNLHDFLLFMIIIFHTCQTNLGIVLVVVLVTPGWTNSPRWLQPGGAAGQVLWSSAAAELLGPPGSRLPGGKSWRQSRSRWACHN